MNNKKEKFRHYSPLSEYELPHLSIDREYIGYFREKSERGKTGLEKDIERVLHGNIDKFNIDALNKKIHKLEKVAEAKLNSEYARRIANIGELMRYRALQAERIKLEIDQLESIISESIIRKEKNHD